MIYNSVFQFIRLFKFKKSWINSIFYISYIYSLKFLKDYEIIEFQFKILIKIY